MAKKKTEEAVTKPTEAEIAQASLDHFEREKRGYEKRTGITVTYVPPTPLALMPVEGEEVPSPKSQVPESTAAEVDDTEGNEPAEGEG